MKINVNRELGLVGKTIELDVQELIVLANLSQELDFINAKMLNSKGSFRLSYDESKTFQLQLQNAIGFLCNITEDVKSNKEVSDELFIIEGQPVEMGGRIPLKSAQEIDADERRKLEEREQEAFEADVSSHEMSEQNPE